MDQIPVPPLGAQPEPPKGSMSLPPRQKRRSVFGKVLRGVGWLGSSPVQWMGLGSIRQGASFIGGMVDRARAPAARDPRFRTADLGDFDLSATAFNMGMTVTQLKQRLAARRRQTAVTAYLFGALSVAFFSAWLSKVLGTPSTGGRLILAFDFLPLCILFVLLAFYQALVNFQIRVGRTAGWREYFTTERGFWPRT